MPQCISLTRKNCLSKKRFVWSLPSDSNSDEPAVAKWTFKYWLLWDGSIVIPSFMSGSFCRTTTMAYLRTPPSLSWLQKVKQERYPTQAEDSEAFPFDAWRSKRVFLWRGTITRQSSYKRWCISMVRSSIFAGTAETLISDNQRKTSYNPLSTASRTQKKLREVKWIAHGCLRYVWLFEGNLRIIHVHQRNQPMKN